METAYIPNAAQKLRWLRRPSDVQRDQGKDGPSRLGHEKDEQARNATEEELHSALRPYVLLAPAELRTPKIQFLHK
jgi:hypothetical protein